MKPLRLFWVCLLILVLLPFSMKIRAGELPDTVYLEKIERIDTGQCFIIRPGEDIFLGMSVDNPNLGRPFAIVNLPGGYSAYCYIDTVKIWVAIPTRQIIEDWMEFRLRLQSTELDWRTDLDEYLKHKGGVVKDD